MVLVYPYWLRECARRTVAVLSSSSARGFIFSKGISAGTVAQTLSKALKFSPKTFPESRIQGTPCFLHVWAITAQSFPLSVWESEQPSPVTRKSAFSSFSSREVAAIARLAPDSGTALQNARSPSPRPPAAPSPEPPQDLKPVCAM